MEKKKHLGTFLLSKSDDSHSSNSLIPQLQCHLHQNLVVFVKFLSMFQAAKQLPSADTQQWHFHRSIDTFDAHSLKIADGLGLWV